jgi:tyrosine-protein kinase Etk/Wzc
MAKNTPMPPPAGINFGDILYVLFKHKWKIIFFTTLALAGAAAFYLKAPVPYVSEAKVLVRYVVDRSAIDRVDNTASTNSRNNDEITVINSQLAILSSLDLARQAGVALTGDLKKRLVPEAQGDAVVPAAAAAISRGLTVGAAKGSNVILLSFKHNDPVVATGVLNAVIQQFLKMHLQIYRSAGAASLVQANVTASDLELKSAEQRLIQLRQEKRIRAATINEEVAKLSLELARAEAELNDARTKEIEQKARVGAIEQLLKGTKKDEPGTENTPVAEAGGALPEPVAPEAAVQPAATVEAKPVASPAAKAGPDGRVVSEYQQLMARLSALRATNASLLARFTPENDAVRVNQAQIDALEAQRTTLEDEYPQLIATAVQAAGGGPVSGLDLVTEQAALAGAQARTQALVERVQLLEKGIDDTIASMPALAQAEREKEIKEGNYKYLMTSQEKANIDKKLIDTTNAPNINVIQEATPASQDIKKRDKIALGIAGGGPAATVGLVLLFGLLLNRTIKRPAEFEEKLGFPLMMAIPYFKRLRDSRPASAPKLKGPTNDKKQLTAPDDSTAPWDPNHSIRPHAEALRDRLGLYFEVNGIDHKPKLIAVTGQTPGAGASTVASGIAAALSETGDGKVLLVDMGGTQGAAHPFMDGRPAPSLSAAIRSSRGADEAADNLFLAKADGTPAGRTSIGAARLSRLMPDLKASYFDYIIFDMPALGNTSPTPAMAAFMDQVIVVVESETSTREEILRNHRDLTDTHAKVSVVLNKVKAHGPKALVGNL